jgi:hypothetical protein
MEIELAIEEGKTIGEITDMLQADYKLPRAYALSLVNQTADLYRAERSYEIY